MSQQGQWALQLELSRSLLSWHVLYPSRPHFPRKVTPLFAERKQILLASECLVLLLFASILLSFSTSPAEKGGPLGPVLGQPCFSASFFILSYLLPHPHILWLVLGFPSHAHWVDSHCAFIAANPGKSSLCLACKLR